MAASIQNTLSLMPSSSTQNELVGFLDLPLEIRCQIYSYFVRKSAFNVSTFRGEEWCVPGQHMQHGLISLLLVSKQVYQEASDVLYGSTEFQVGINFRGGSCLRKLNVGTRRRIRKLIVVARAFRMYEGPYHPALSRRLWSPLLSQLTHLAIVVQQPVQQPYHRPSHHKQQLTKWVDWIKPIMNYIGQSLHPRCTVAVDDNGKGKETRALVKMSFPHGFCQVQTPTGDFHFGRGESIESRYWNSMLGPLWNHFG